MTGLIAEVIARLQTLTAGEEFDNPVSVGATSPLKFEKGFLEPKRQGASAADDINFVLVRIKGGIGRRREGQVVVRLIGGIHTNGDKDAGQADIERLLGLLVGIEEKRGFTGYRLSPKPPWFFGDPEEGIQPHPKYYVTVDLTFTANQ